MFHMYQKSPVECTHALVPILVGLKVNMEMYKHRYRSIDREPERFPFVSIIIVNWNGKALLKDCLTSLHQNTDYPNFNVIIVDNGSKDNSVTMLGKEFPWVELIVNNKNLGFAKANNQAIKYLFKKGTEYFFLLNNDTKIIQKDWLRNIIQVAELTPKIGIVGCKLIYPDGRIHQNYKYSKIADVESVIGAAFLIRKEVVKKIGLLDEGFTPAYGEETDYCFRAKKAGYRIVCTSETTIIHYGGASTKGQSYWLGVRMKNYVRQLLLNCSFKLIIVKSIGVIFLDWKDNERKYISISNFKLREDCNQQLLLMFKAYLRNFGDLRDILKKRRNRLMKIWY